MFSPVTMYFEIPLEEQNDINEHYCST